MKAQALQEKAQRASLSTVNACRLHFKEQRDKIGVECQRCGGNSHYWIKSRWSYSVSLVAVALLFVVAQLCRVPICLFWYGIVPCF